MKVLIGVAFLAMLSLGGCLETPAYSAGERFQKIADAQTFDVKSINDDVDDALMLRPQTHLTYWNVWHSY